MKSLLQLHVSVLVNLGQLCSIDIARDVRNVTERCEDEGDGYLTITLPKFGKALERGLDTGTWPAQDVAPTWRHVRGLPAFMRGFLSRIFDESGSILESPDTDSIWAVRQFCFLTQKVERACTPQRERAAIDQFVSTDRELIGLPGRIDPERLSAFIKRAHELFGDVFQECDRKVASYELIPRHGPGAVAEKLTQLGKRSAKYRSERLEGVFPSWRYYSNLPTWENHHDPVPISEELPVRVVSVPKTQSTPRIIAIEPSAVQYAQQGLKREIYELIARGPLSKVLGFHDQTRNREMARLASLDGSLATLDLSEASDRVHWFLVHSMLQRYPHLAEFVWATRSATADVPFHGVLPLQKFASMGSALTFPMEAIVFTTLAILGIEQTENRHYRSRQLPGRVSVYGDDIIVPVGAIDCVVDWLQHFGAKVNLNKSFWTGRFRESCGAEYYGGTDVSVVRVRHELPSSRSDAAEIAALVDLRNRAYTAGLFRFADDLDRELDTLIGLPYTSATRESSSAYMHKKTFLPFDPGPTRYNSELQREERKVPQLRARSERYRVDGEAGLLEWFHSVLTRNDFVNRYDGQERAVAFSINHRWVCTSS